jgi:hypothetical protein
VKQLLETGKVEQIWWFLMSDKSDVMVGDAKCCNRQKALKDHGTGHIDASIQLIITPSWVGGVARLQRLRAAKQQVQVYGILYRTVLLIARTNRSLSAMCLELPKTDDLGPKTRC